MCWLTLWPKHQWHTTDIKWEGMKCRKYQGHISWTHHQQTTEAKQEERNTINASLSPSLEAQIWKKWSSIIRKTDLKFCCHVSKSYWSIIWLFIFNKIKLYTSFNMWYIFSLILLASTFSFKAFFWEIYWLLTSNKQHATKSY